MKVVLNVIMMSDSQEIFVSMYGSNQAILWLQNALCTDKNTRNATSKMERKCGFCSKWDKEPMENERPLGLELIPRGLNR